MFYFEMKSLFFCLIKRTKNQGFGIVVKAQISIFSWDFRSEALYFVRSWKADFVGDLLRSFLQKSSISVRSQNPTIPRPKVILNWELGFVNEIDLSWFWDDLFWNEISVLLLEQKNQNQGFGIVVKAQILIFSWDYRSEALYFVHSWKCWFCWWSAAQLPPKV